MEITALFITMFLFWPGLYLIMEIKSLLED